MKATATQISHIYTISTKLQHQSELRSKNLDIKTILDLDANCEFYAMEQNFNEAIKQINIRTGGEVSVSKLLYQFQKLNNKHNNLKYLLETLMAHPGIKDIGYYDITPCEIKHLYCVIRLINPNFLPICSPSFPYLCHP